MRCDCAVRKWLFDGEKAALKDARSQGASRDLSPHSR
jgi:hypothetical protein